MLTNDIIQQKIHDVMVNVPQNSVLCIILGKSKSRMYTSIESESLLS